MTILGALVFVLGAFIYLAIVGGLIMYAGFLALIVALGILIFELPQPYSYIVFCFYLFCLLLILYNASTKR